MILITKTNVYINMATITTMGVLEDKKTLVINNQAIVFDSREECLDIFNTITTFLKNTSIYGIKDMRENEDESKA